MLRSAQTRLRRTATRSWVDRLSSLPAFIIGTGPSIHDEQIDLSILSDYCTIGINRAIYYLDPTILFWQDPSFLMSEKELIIESQALKYCRDVADPTAQYFNYHLHATANKYVKKTHTLSGRGSSGPMACQLAYALGCSPVVLVGLDGHLGRDGRTDSYGCNKYWNPNTLTSCKNGLLHIKDHCPVPVINCSTNGLWPRVTLEQAIQLVDPLKQYAKGRKWYLNKILKGDCEESFV